MMNLALKSVFKQKYFGN